MNNPLLNFKNRILFLFLFASLFFSCTAFFPTEQETGYPAIITSVIDGDTVTIRFNTDILPSGCNRTERVRLIGINTPELTINPPEYYAKEARDFLNQYYLTPIIVKFDSVLILYQIDEIGMVACLLTYMMTPHLTVLTGVFFIMAMDISTVCSPLKLKRWKNSK